MFVEVDIQYMVVFSDTLYDYFKVEVSMIGSLINLVSKSSFPGYIYLLLDE